MKSSYIAYCLSSRTKPVKGRATESYIPTGGSFLTSCALISSFNVGGQHGYRWFVRELLHIYNGATAVWPIPISDNHRASRCYHTALKPFRAYDVVFPTSIAYCHVLSCRRSRLRHFNHNEVTSYPPSEHSASGGPRISFYRGIKLTKF